MASTVTAVEGRAAATPPSHEAPPPPQAGGGHPEQGFPAQGPVWEPTPPGPVRRAMDERPWIAPAVTGVGLALAAAYTFWQDPNRSGAFPACPLREATGWDCPGCGGLRATHALMHGDLAGALDHNVFLAIAVPVVALLWLRWMVSSLGARVPSLSKVPGRAWWVLGTAVLAFTVVRNIPGVGAFEYLNSFT